MLTPTDISSMRSVAEQALPGTAIIQNHSFSDDGGGGGTATWTASGTVDCRLAPMRGGEREIADRIAEDADFLVTLPTTASVTVQSRLLIAGGTFNVAAIRDRSWEITQRVEVVKQV